MNNKTLIITGLVIFLIIVLFPFWYMRGKAAPAPELDGNGCPRAPSVSPVTRNQGSVWTGSGRSSYGLARRSANR